MPVFIGFHDFQTSTQFPEGHEILDAGRSPRVADTPFPHVILNIREDSKDANI